MKEMSFHNRGYSFYIPNIPYDGKSLLNFEGEALFILVVTSKGFNEDSSSLKSSWIANGMSKGEGPLSLQKDTDGDKNSSVSFSLPKESYSEVIVFPQPLDIPVGEESQNNVSGSFCTEGYKFPFIMDTSKNSGLLIGRFYDYNNRRKFKYIHEEVPLGLDSYMRMNKKEK